MFKPYIPADHYWLRAAGTAYSSARQAEVAADDTAYAAWLDAGNVPTAYPLDEAGEESEAELAAVLGHYGLYVSKADAMRALRDKAITSCGWLVARHRDQVDAGAACTLTTDEYAELLAYRQALRDWPAVTGWPDVDLPTAPSFVE